MAKLNDTALNILRGLPHGTDEEKDLADAAANVVENAESNVRAEMARLGFDDYQEDVIRRILGAIAAQYQ